MTAFGLMFRVVAEMEQRIVTLVRFHPYISADSAVSTGRSAARNKFLPPERGNAVSAVSGFNFYLYSIYEHLIDSTQVWERRQIWTEWKLKQVGAQNQKRQPDCSSRRF